MNQKYLDIVKHYENCLEKNGDTHLGVDWPNKKDADKRHQVMAGIIKTQSKKVNLLDFGCGTSHFYEYIQKKTKLKVNYSGLDISQKFIDLSKKKYPQNKYYCLDLLKNSNKLPEFDYIIMNGVFTEKRTLSQEEMWSFFCKMLKQVYKKTKTGVAFNVMSKHVDWERKDLFHVPFDKLAKFIISDFTRDFVFRNDYGLYEYTTYIYKK
ncbi:MAG: class I SAM-dependent methyltransferase [Patescibacteria group bacterium]